MSDYYNPFEANEAVALRMQREIYARQMDDLKNAQFMQSMPNQYGLGTGGSIVSQAANTQAQRLVAPPTTPPPEPNKVLLLLGDEE